MLRKSSSRNLYLQKSCESFSHRKLDETMGEVFFDRIKQGEKILQQVAVKDFNTFEEIFHVGMPDVELRNIVSKKSFSILSLRRKKMFCRSETFQAKTHLKLQTL